MTSDAMDDSRQVCVYVWPYSGRLGKAKFLIKMLLRD